MVSTNSRIRAALPRKPRAFLSALKDFLRDENAAELRIQALVSGREIVIQTHDTELTNKPVLHLLPYFLAPEEIAPPSSRSYTYKDPEMLLQEDQRDTWWRRYTGAKDRRESLMPAPLKRQPAKMPEGNEDLSRADFGAYGGERAAS